MGFGRHTQNFAIVAAVFCNLVLLVLIGRLYPEFAVDGGILQSITAILFFLTAFLAAFMTVRPATLQPRAERLLMACVAFMATIFCLSEISFGAQYFDIAMPAMRGGGEFDGAHDVVILTVRYVASLTLVGQVVVAAVALALAAVCASLAVRYRASITPIWNSVLTNPVYFLFAVTFGLLAVAVLLDLSNGWTLTLIEESAEAIASMAMLSAVVLAYRASTARQRMAEGVLRQQAGLGLRASDRAAGDRKRIAVHNTDVASQYRATCTRR